MKAALTVSKKTALIAMAGQLTRRMAVIVAKGAACRFQAP
jgi:hypothetical protein